MSKTEESELFNTQEISGITVIETMEDMDLYSALRIKEYFNNLCSIGKNKFIINLKNTRYLDSSGLGVLIHIHTTAIKDKNIIMRFICIADTVFKVLKLTHLDNMFAIAKDLETAIKEINNQQTHAPGYVKDDNSIDDSDDSKPELAKRWDPDNSDDDDDFENNDTDKTDYKFINGAEADALISDAENAEIKETKVDIKQININENSTLFEKAGLQCKTFYVGIVQIQKVMQTLFAGVRMEKEEQEHLEHQVYEILKNAVKHGNKGKWWKPLKIWYRINESAAHFIIEDKGKGFQQLEQWNELFKQRAICYQQKDRQNLKKYRAFRTEASDKSDRGTALFSAIEYWNGGIVFNEKRNTVAIKLYFSR